MFGKACEKWPLRSVTFGTVLHRPFGHSEIVLYVGVRGERAVTQHYLALLTCSPISLKRAAARASISRFIGSLRGSRACSAQFCRLPYSADALALDSDCGAA